MHIAIDAVVLASGLVVIVVKKKQDEKQGNKKPKGRVTSGFYIFTILTRLPPE